MADIVIAKTEQLFPSPAGMHNEAVRESLEDVLDYLSRFGLPRLSKQRSGWFCAVELTASHEGVESKVASDFGMPSTIKAAQVCRDRLVAAMKGKQ